MKTYKANIIVMDEGEVLQIEGSAFIQVEVDRTDNTVKLSFGEARIEVELDFVAGGDEVLLAVRRESGRVSAAHEDAMFIHTGKDI